jgi:hypothetical protein
MKLYHRTPNDLGLSPNDNLDADKPYREFIMPASFANQFGPPKLIDD